MLDNVISFPLWYHGEREDGVFLSDLSSRKSCCRFFSRMKKRRIPHSFKSAVICF